jgi:hypothetical protein
VQKGPSDIFTTCWKVEAGALRSEEVLSKNVVGDKAVN